MQQTKTSAVTLRRSRTLFSVTAPAFELTTTLIDAIFPAYQCVIPAASSNSASGVRSELADALVRLGAIAVDIDGGPLVALSWTEGGPLRLFLPRQPLDADDAINAEVHGNAQVAVSLGQLRIMVDNFDDDRLQIESANSMAPIAMRGAHDKLGVLSACRWRFETAEDHHHQRGANHGQRRKAV